MKYVIVTRISDVQQQDGTSPESQLEDCLKYIKGASYIHFHDIGKGGIPLKKRKVLLEAISHLEKGDVLLCPRSDRLSRNGDTIALIKHLVQERGGTIEYADGTKIACGANASDWLQTKMLEVLAEYERLVLSGRIRRAYKQKRAKGEAMGRVPYGYKIIEGFVVEDVQQQAILASMHALREQGKSFREIAQLLNSQGLYNCYNRPWHYPNIHRILKRIESEQGNLPVHA